jgi:hypothetical protein
MDPAINGLSPTDISGCFNDLATYFKAAGAAYSATIGGAPVTDVEASFTAIAAYFKLASAAMDPTINGLSPTDVSDCFLDLATYFKAAGAAMDPTINGASPTDISDCFDALATYFKAAGAAFSATIGGGAATDVEAAFTALAALFNAASAAMAVTIDNGGSVRTNLNDIFNDLGAILDGAGVTTWPVSADPGNGVNLFAAVRKMFDLTKGMLTTNDEVPISITPVITGEKAILFLGHIVRLAGTKSGAFTIGEECSNGGGTAKGVVLAQVGGVGAGSIDVGMTLGAFAPGDTVTGAISTNTIDSSLTITDLVVDGHYMVDSLMLHTTDPAGGDSLTVNLYQLLNGALPALGSPLLTYTFVGGAGAGNFSLTTMFGTDHLAGDVILVTVLELVGGAPTVTGSYAYRSA